MQNYTNYDQFELKKVSKHILKYEQDEKDILFMTQSAFLISIIIAFGSIL